MDSCVLYQGLPFLGLVISKLTEFLGNRRIRLQPCDGEPLLHVGSLQVLQNDSGEDVDDGLRGAGRHVHAIPTNQFEIPMPRHVPTA